MRKRIRWLGYALLTAANIGLLLLTYAALTNMTTPVAPKPIQQFQQDPNSTAFPTPTPIPFVRMVQALQNIPRGYRFPNTIQELENIAGYVAWPEAAMPFNALSEYDGGLERLLGKVARTDIFREQPILSTLLADSMASMANIGSDLGAMIYPDKVAKTIHLSREMLTTGPVVGDHVNVYFTKDKTTALLVDDAVVLWIGDLPADGRIPLYPTPTPIPYYDNESSVRSAPTLTPSPTLENVVPVVLMVSNQDAAELIWAEQNDIPLALVIRSASDVSRTNINPVSQNTLPH